MAHTLRGYSALIASSIDQHDHATVALVEDFMRQETGGCLDHLSADRFIALARLSYADARAWHQFGDVNGTTLATYCEAARLEVPTWARHPV